MKPATLLEKASQFTPALQAFVSAPQLGLQLQQAAFPTFAFSEDWQVLGPWQIGTREAIWGADPLERYGGFRSLEYDEKASFTSSLPFNGSVSWSCAKAKLGYPQTYEASAALSIDFPDVDWSFLQQIYGWSALQWQGWARGEIMVQRAGTVPLALDVESILELWIDETHYFGGDFYGLKRAPVVLWLAPGVHRIDVRLFRDVRAMGGMTAKPSIDIKLQLQLRGKDLKQSSKLLIAHNVETRDGTLGKLASQYTSVVVRNDNPHHSITVEAVDTEASLDNECIVGLLAPSAIKLVPGQSRPVAMRIACMPSAKPFIMPDLHVKYRVGDSPESQQLRLVDSTIAGPVKARQMPHKITYLHPGGIVSYAILRPPSAAAIDKCPSNSKLPILLALHGAGLEADSDLVTQSLDSVPDLCAWVLFPTGVTPWSSDDWHTWGFADVEAAIEAIPEWIEQNDWEGPGVDTSRWLVMGHSNGGQGAWYAITHRPDNVIAAAPLSGYSSIQNYVPYTFWTSADPARIAIVQAGLNLYRHELLLANAKGIPILQQHGSADDNVPAYHSRLLHQLLEQSGASSEYVEMADKPHWWDGVMEMPQLQDFYEHHLMGQTSKDSLPVNLRDFTVVTADPGSTGPKYGFQILLLMTSGQFGKIEVTHDPLTLACVCQTQNVRMFGFSRWFSECSRLVIDGEELAPFIARSNQSRELLKTTEGQWRLTTDAEDVSALSLLTLPLPATVRQGRQLGSIEAILRSRGTFQIVHHTMKDGVEAIGLQVSRNLAQYFYADAEITSDYAHALSETGNVISIAIGADLPTAAMNISHAIELHEDRLAIRDARGGFQGYGNRGRGLAAAFLRPLPDERLELVLWGVDAKSLAIAARLVPLMTGTGVPDFVVADNTMLWKGIDGTLAMGFLDERWNASLNAFFI